MRVGLPAHRRSRATCLEVVTVLAWKLRIAVLWICVSVVNVSIMILLMFEPGRLSDLMAGEWLGGDAHSAGFQVAVAFNLLSPIALAFLTLVLTDAAGRRTNQVVGALGAVMAILGLTGLIGGTFGGGVVFAYLVGTLALLLIVWHAWKWPPSGEGTTPHHRQGRTGALTTR